MAEKVDAITLEIEATTEKADKGIDKTIESLKALKTALNGINTKKLKQEMESFEDFQKKLQTAFSDIKISGNTEELKKQIAQAEARLDSLMKKENKLKTVSGINENSKQYRNLQYDIAQVCSSLDQMYEAMDRADTQKPLNFWEKPNWSENLQNYGTTDESVINSRLGSAEDVEKIESAVTYAADNIKQSFTEVAQTEKEAEKSLESLSGKMQGLKGIAEQLKTAFSGIREKLPLGFGADKFNADMQDLIDGMNQAKHTMKQMESGAKAFDSTAYERAARELSEATAQMQKYKSSLTGATEHTDRLKTILSGIGGAVKGAFSKVGAIGSGIVSACKKATGALRGLKSQISKLGTAFSGLGKKIGAVTKLFSFMLLRRAITALLNTVKQGFDTLAQYSSAKGTEFNSNISMMQSSLKTLGNSLVAAFEPIINVVAPILTAFIDKLTAATNAIGQFFAALTGNSTYTKAKKVVSDYAGSLDKATASTKKLATATAGIDELNILQDNSDSSGAGASNPADSFETGKVGDKFANLAQMIKDAWEKADFSEIGAMIADKINSALEGIDWAKIKDTSRKIAQSIGTFVNGFIRALDWTLVGATIGEGVNTALIFANTLLTTIDFGLIGRSLAAGLNSAVNVIDWQAVGSLVCNGINSLIDFLYDFVSTFNYTNLGESIGTAITTAIKNIKWNKGGSAIGKAATGLFDTFNGFIKKTDFASLGKRIALAIGGFFKNLSWSSIGTALSNAIKALADFLYGIVSGTDWAAVPQHIVDTIKDFFTGFDWSGVSKSLGQCLGSAVKGAVDFVGSIWDMLRKTWGNLSDYFNDYIEDAGGDIIAGLWNGITNALANVGNWISENIFKPFVEGFKNAFQIHSPAKTMQPLGSYIVEGVLKGITDKWGEIIDFFSNGLSDIKNKFSEGWENLKTNTSNAWNTIKTVFNDSWINIKNGVVSSWTTIKGNFSVSWSNIIDGVKNSWLSITQRFTSAWSDIKNGVADSWTTIKAGFSGGMSNVLSSVKTGWVNIKDSFTSGVAAIKRTITDVKWSEIGENIINGIWKGISDGWKWLTDKVKKLANDLYEAAKEALDIHSPSRKFAEIGRYSVLGFNEGLNENAKSSLQAVRDWFAPLENVSLNTRLRINDSALKDYQNNYGSDFSNEAIVQRVTKEVSTAGTIQTTINSGGGLKEAFSEVAERILLPAIQSVEIQAKRQADKNEQTIVEIGGRLITDVVKEQKGRNGFAFTT